MKDTSIITEVETYAKSAGLSPSTVCVRATGNSRLLDRLKRRANQTETDLVRLRAYMAENPTSEAAQ